MKKKIKLFCFGFGQVGKYFVKNLLKKKIDFDLVTTNTTESGEREINEFKYKSFFFSGEQYDTSLLKELNSSSNVLISISPKNQDDLVLKVFDTSL